MLTAAATAAATATECSFTQCVALLQPGKTLAAEELNRWRQHALLARNAEFLRNYSDPFFDDIIDERLDSLQFPAIRVKCVTGAPAAACARPPTVWCALMPASNASHCCAGIVPHLR